MNVYDTLALIIVAVNFFITGMASLKIIYTDGDTSISVDDKNISREFFINLASYSNIVAGIGIGLSLLVAYTKSLV